MQIYELNTDLSKIVPNYLDLISNYPAFFLIVLAVLIYGVLIYVNLNSKATLYLTILGLVGAIAASFYFRGIDMFNNIKTIFTSKFYLNIYGFYWGAIIALLIMSLLLNNKKQNKSAKVVTLSFYIMIMINLIFSFYITGSMREYLLTLVNITPMIFIGNILILVLYIYLLIRIIIAIVKKENKPFFRR
jgi:hypothetical protein